MNFKDRILVHQETIVVRFTKLNDNMRETIHQKLVQDGWFRNQDVVDTAPSIYGPDHVTYYRWVDTDKRSYG